MLFFKRSMILHRRVLILAGVALLMVGWTWTSHLGNQSNGNLPPEVFDDGFEGGDTLSWGGEKVIWDPGRLEVTIGEGDHTPVRVTLKIQVDLPATILYLTPSLSEWVSIPTEQLPPLTAGTELEIDFILTALAVQEKGGTLHVRQAEGPPRTFAKPLPILITGVEGVPLPPEPDPNENDATLEGVDSNNDGIRDDIERFIALNWKESVEREALRQYASQFNFVYSPDSYEQAAAGLTTARSCLFAVMSAQDAWNASRAIRIKYLNTLERSHAYFNYDDSLSGRTFSVPIETTSDCTFPVEEIQ